MICESEVHGKGLIAVDWGTTNRRIFVLGADGSVERREADARGVTAIAADDFPAEMAALRDRFGERPLLLAGMIGSTRGWVEAPYVSCPVTLPQLAEHILWVEPGRTAIVPGACVADGELVDVMRGEEVQAFGAVAAGLIAPDGLLCQPGTHAKWVRLEVGALTGFRTVMTGELFALLRDHSILSVQMIGDSFDGAAFREGVRRGLDHPGALTSHLFGTRARILLGRLGQEDAASYVSGLLIGADVATGLDLAAGPVGLIGAPALNKLYAAALDEAGRSHQEVDGEEAFLAGARALAEILL